MRFSVMEGATVLTFSSVVVSAPLPSSMISSHSLDVSPHDQTHLPGGLQHHRRDAQLVVPFVPNVPRPSSLQSKPKGTTESVPDILPNPPAGEWIRNLKDTSPTLTKDEKKRARIKYWPHQLHRPYIPTHTKPHTSTDHAKRQQQPLPKEDEKKTNHEKVKDDDQKEASGKSIDPKKAPSELLVEENKKKGTVHGGCRERAMARPIVKRDVNKFDELCP